MATDMAEKIKISGWAAWELRPQGQAPAGIAAFIFALTRSKLWLLIPLNAALHASAFLVLSQLLNLLIKDQTKSFLCALPFLIFPSNLQWTSQLHKDGFSILGVVLILQGIVSLSRLENYKIGNWFFINFRSIISCICGFISIWLVRPMLLMVMQPILGLLFSLLIVIFLIRVFKKVVSWQKALTASLSLLLIFFMFSQDKIYRGSIDFGPSEFVYDNKIKPEDYEMQDLPEPAITAQPTIEKPPLVQEPVVKLARIEEPKPRMQDVEVKRRRVIKNLKIEIYWTRLSWLPPFIENKFQSLAMMRRGFRFTAPEAGSNIDMDIGFNSIKSILVYLPRAARIVFLAPFPYHRFSSKGSYAASPLMRKIATLEMMVVYFVLIFLFYAIWHWRKRIEIWIIFIFCASMMLVYGLVICNIGTLYRMRYVYITTLVAFGIAGFFAFLEQLAIRLAIRKDD